MANNLSLNNVLNVSVATAQQGLGTPNTGNLAIFSREAYATTFGTAGYKIYLSATQVGIDFGTTSNTYAMALQVFSQQPNILAAGGYLVIIPFLANAQSQVVLVTFPGVAVSGNFTVVYNGAANSVNIAYNDTPDQVQTSIQGLTGLSSATVTGTFATGLTINTNVSGVGHPVIFASSYVFTVSAANCTTGATYTDANGDIFTALQTVAGGTSIEFYGTGTPAASGTLTKTSGTGDSTITYSAYVTPLDVNGKVVNPVVTIVVPGAAGESLDQAIIRTQPLVAYFGVMAAEIASQIITLAAAAYIQTQNLIGFFVSYTSSDLTSGGMLYAIQQTGYTQSRGLFYDDVLADALTFQAGYASLLLSVNYQGSATCITMNLKSLTGQLPDPNITQTIVNSAAIAGADIYVSLAGVPKVLSYGANDFSDNQTNLQAFAQYIRTAYFNVLAQTNTKIPQTEAGMNLIKSALRAVCNQFVVNGFLAPGTWTNPTTFGNQANLISNVAQFGYYIYSSPISQQAPSSRTARTAPPIQIAIKYAGAEQNGSVVIYVNP